MYFFNSFLYVFFFNIFLNFLFITFKYVSDNHTQIWELLFIQIAGSLGHSRVNIDIVFFRSRFHAGHHEFFTCNYAQNIEIWDKLFGTFRDPKDSEMMDERIIDQKSVVKSKFSQTKFRFLKFSNLKL